MTLDDFTDGTCIIWNSFAQVLDGGTGFRVNSARAGGDYRITREAASSVGSLSPHDRAKLTSWLVEQRRMGDEAPLVDDDAIRRSISRRNLRYIDKEILLLIAMQELGLDLPGSKQLIDFEGSYDLNRIRTDHLAARVEATDRYELSGLLALAAKRGLVSYEGRLLTLEPDGYARLDELENGGANTRQAFVAMWFGEEMREAWRLGFAPAIRDAGYDPFRIDSKEHNNKIDDEIVAEIKRSRFLIADFTCGAEIVKKQAIAIPRGGVYYEAGLAHGLGMEVIFSCRRDRINDLHFDTRQFAHIVWDEPADLRAALYNRVAATVKEAPGAPGRGKGSVDPAPDQPPRPKVTLV